MKKNLLSLGAVFFCALLIFSSCQKGGGLNLFSVSQDKELGQQLKKEVMANPAKYPILPYAGNEKAYNYLYAMRDEILKAPTIKYRNQFTWELHIIKDDKTLNAFAAPGGFMCVYTGLIKYLDKADHLAGVLGHEIAHADQRHSTQNLTKTYGLQTLITIASGGKSSLVGEMLASLTQLSFSRNHEKDADDHSVEYLCGTSYAANGAAGFFEKLMKSKSGGSTPAFLSTHPSDASRVKDINAKAQALKCKTTYKANAGWETFKAYF